MAQPVQKAGWAIKLDLKMGRGAAAVDLLYQPAYQQY